MDSRATTPFVLLGNLPCLDLVNTEAMGDDGPIDRLPGFDDLLAWLEAAGLATAAEQRAAAEAWRGTSPGAALFRTARELRGLLRTTAERLVEGRAVPRELVPLLNRVLASRPTWTELATRAGGYVTREVSGDPAPLHLLVPVARSAAWLLEHGDRSLLRRCENPDCVLFFYDTTKNGRRRWCSMAGCGSRAKAAAYYRRHR